MTSRRPVLVALSGGVDSATAAGLLAEAGQPLVSVFMRNGVSSSGPAAARSCCALSDAADARAVADRLGIPFYVLDLSRPFERLIEAFCRDYAAGRTPNPCVLCNNDLKFGELMTFADDLGCDGVATGHYARLEQGVLRRAADRHKDQSYLLHGLTAAQRARAQFPLGGLDKTTVRAHARRLELRVADKPDSADICFVPGGDYRAVVEQRLGTQGAAGPLVDTAGRTIGQHAGVAGFTVGQRRGLGVALGHPAYVTAIDAKAGRVTVGRREALQRTRCRVGGMNWCVPEEPADPASGRPRAVPERLLVQLRHHHEPEAAWLRMRGRAAVELEFERPSSDVTPGQYAVLYDGDRVLGGGRILDEPPTS